MGRTLRYLGLLLIAGSVWLYLSEAMGWISPGLAAEWGGFGLRAGALCVVGGLLSALLAPVGRELRRGRCVRCGAPIERGQTYCMDHLRQTVNEFRDRTREQMANQGTSER